MIIFAGDLARKTGWAIGEAGKSPKSGSWLLREKFEDDGHLEPGRLVEKLSVLVADIRPDLVAVERPVGLGKFARTSAAALEAQHRLHGALDAWCYISRIDCVRVDVRTARVATVGYASAPKPKGRKPKSGEMSKMSKVMVRDWLAGAGLLPEGCADLDRSDAVLIHAWASQVHGGCLPKLPLLG